MTVAAGKLRLDTIDAFNNFTQTSSGGFLTLNGGTLQWGGSTATANANPLAISSSNGTIEVMAAATNLALPGVLSGAGSLTKTGTGTLTLSGTNTYTGGTTISAGTLQIGTGGTNGLLPGNVVNNASLVFNRSDAATYAGLVSGTGSLTKAGTGTLTLTNSGNSYTGTTFVNAGTLKLGTASADQIPLNGNVTVAIGATFNIGSPGSSANTNAARPAGTITLNGGTLVAEGSASLSGYHAGGLAMTGGSLDFTQTTSSQFFFNLRGAVAINAANTAAFWIGSSSAPAPGYATLSNNTAGPLAITVATGTSPGGIDLDSSVSINGTWIKDGAGVMRMTSQLYTNTNLTVADGKLRLDNIGTFNVFTNSGSALSLNGGTFQWGGSSTTANASPLAIGSGNGTIEVMTAASNLALPGVLSGAGSLTKTGPGTLTLSGANTYGGGTTISAGILRVNNTAGSATGTGSVLVRNGGTLGGGGTAPGIAGIVSGAVTVQAGGQVAPGNSAGILNLNGGVTFQAGSTLAIELNSATLGTGYDQLKVNGTASLAGILQLTLGFTPQNSDVFTIVSASAISGTFASVQNMSGPGTFTISYTANSVVLSNFQPVPEPTTILGLAAMGLAVAGGIRRKRAKGLNPDGAPHAP